MGAPENVVRRIWGQPFVMSEYGYCAPSGYRSVGGLLIGSLAALQDWSGVWRFAWSHGLQGVEMSESKPLHYFDLSGDPLAMAAERAAVCLFLRGDLKPHEESYLLHLPPERLRHPGVPAPMASVRWPWVAWYARTGCALKDDVADGVRIAGVLPDVFSRPEEDVRREVRIGGPVSLDQEKGTFSVATPCTCGVFAEVGNVSAGPLTVELTGSRATVWASSLDGLALVDSKRILVTHLTDVLDSGTRFGDPRHRTLLAWGHLPHLMRNGVAHISLMLGKGNYQVYALSADGSRRRQVAASIGSDGRLQFTANVGDDSDAATWLYEISNGK